MDLHRELFFFTPLIAAMAGNVGVQSSAIIVQGLANNTIIGPIVERLLKELSLSLLNGVILSVILLAGSYFLLGYDWVVFCQLFGAMIDLPTGFPMFCRDIKQVAVQMGNPSLPHQSPEAEHNALSDAKWNREAHQYLERLCSTRTVSYPWPG